MSDKDINQNLDDEVIKYNKGNDIKFTELIKRRDEKITNESVDEPNQLEYFTE